MDDWAFGVASERMFVTFISSAIAVLNLRRESASGFANLASAI